MNISHIFEVNPKPTPMTYEEWEVLVEEILKNLDKIPPLKLGSHNNEILKFKNKSCGRKKQHETEEEARLAGLHDPALRPYQCIFCKKWHAGRKGSKTNYDKLRREIEKVLGGE
jgi:hypothetical protein